MMAWSREGNSQGWTVGVADPRNPGDNVAPKVRLALHNQAIATSGNYERFYTNDGKKYSHIIDPRTGQPVQKIISSSVVAPDCATADALATILSVLEPSESLALVKTIPGAHCMMVGADGKEYASEGWAKLATPRPAAAATSTLAGDASLLPEKGQLTFSMDLKKTWMRPYVTVWVEDSAGKAVKTLAVWGRETKYLKQMTSWWGQMGSNENFVQSVSRASRSGGHYTIAWDGRDDQGRRVAKGKYTIRLELYRKEGKRFDLKGTIFCGDQAAASEIPNCPEISGMKIIYDVIGK
jgi:hypothetical protein